MDPLGGPRLDAPRAASLRTAAPAVAPAQAPGPAEPAERFEPGGSIPAPRAKLPASLPPTPGPVGAVLRSLWEAVDYELQRLPGGAGLARQLAPLAVRYATASSLLAVGGPVSSLALLEGLDQRLLGELPPGGERAAYRWASTRARNYLGLDGAALARTAPLPPRAEPGSPPARAGYPPEVASVRVDQVDFPGVAGYVASRLGPVTSILDGLGSRDRVRFSNQPVSGSLDGLPRIGRSERLSLPISSWNKTVELLTHEDGTRTLLFADFPGRSLMRHFQLLARHRLEGRPDAPSASTVEAPEGYEATYQSMARLFRARPEALAGVSALVVGYETAFRQDWSAEREGSVEDPCSPWKAETYRLSNGTRVAVLSTPDSFHGEVLGQNLRRVVQENPGIRAVYAAGSAGSLHAREPYSVVFPDRLEGREGSAVPNVLSSGTGGGLHRSALSVMEETPDLLRSWRADQVTTVDMEMGLLAEALADLDVKVGVGMLVTDFPAGAAGAPPVELANQDASKKYRHVSDYPSAVRTHLEQGRPAWAHPLEAAAGCSLDELSAANLAREEGWVGEMTPDEARLFQRLEAKVPSYSFRMTPARLGRVLHDGVILSTAQVASLKGAPVQPYTPRVEEELYGAYDYTFGAVGFGRGSDQYGEVRVVLRPETVRARSWATYRSGWQALRSAARENPGTRLDYDSADPALLEAGRKRFSQWVVAPEHYSRSMALFAVEQVRQKGPEVLAELLEAPEERLPELLERHGVGFLEGRIRGSLNLEDVAWVELPAGCSADLFEGARARGLEIRPPSQASRDDAPTGALG